MIEPRNPVLELHYQFPRDKRESTVNVFCATSATVLNISVSEPWEPSVNYISASVVTVTKDTKLKVKSFMPNVQGNFLPRAGISSHSLLPSA